MSDYHERASLSNSELDAALADGEIFEAVKCYLAEESDLRGRLLTDDEIKAELPRAVGFAKAERKSAELAARAAPEPRDARSASPISSHIVRLDLTEEAAAKIPRWCVAYSAFRDDPGPDPKYRDDFTDEGWEAERKLMYSDQQRDFDVDFFGDGAGMRVRLVTAFAREVRRAGLKPLAAGHTALRITRYGPDDPVPVSRIVEVRLVDVPAINAANVFDLENLFEGGDFGTVQAARFGDTYHEDRDLRGRGSPLSIIKNPARPLPAERDTVRDFADGVHLIDFSSEDVVHFPRRQWLIEGLAVRGKITAIIAPGAVGKSLWSLQFVTALGRGDGACIGAKVRTRAKAMVWNKEDEIDEQRLRVAGVARHFGFEPNTLKGWVHLFGSNHLLAVRKGKAIEEGPAVAQLVQYIQDNGIDVLVIDPLVEFHAADENSNSEMAFVMGILKRICRLTNVALVLVHHSRKPGEASSDGHAGNANSSRGASAITNAARLARTLYTITAGEAKDFGISDEDAWRYCRFDDAKNNLGRAGTEQWLKRVSVVLPNGEEVAALEPVTLGCGDRATLCENWVATRITDALIAKVCGKDGKPINFSPKPQAKGDANTVRWLHRNGGGTAGFTVEEIRKALDNITGLIVHIDKTHDAKGDERERYVLRDAPVHPRHIPGT